MNISDFDDLINLGQVRHVFPVGKHEVIMKTLTSLEYGKAMSRVPSEGTAGITDINRLEIMQREVVASALESIDGQKLSHEDKVALLGAGQLGFANLLYSEYLNMVEEQTGIIDEAKKKSSTDQTPSTESQKVLASK